MLCQDLTVRIKEREMNNEFQFFMEIIFTEFDQHLFLQILYSRLIDKYEHDDIDERNIGKQVIIIIEKNQGSRDVQLFLCYCYLNRICLLEPF